MTISNSYCNNPAHSRSATEEEFLSDYNTRFKLRLAALTRGDISERQFQEAAKALEDFSGYPRCTLTDIGALSSSVVNFWNAVHEERQRQKEIGFGVEHDKAHGLMHVLEVAQMYAMRGEMVKTAAILEAAKELQRLEEAKRFSATMAPFEIPVTAAMAKEVWDTFVKPDQDEGSPQSGEMRVLMAILRGAHKSLTAQEEK